MAQPEYQSSSISVRIFLPSLRGNIYSTFGDIFCIFIIKVLKVRTYTFDIFSETSRILKHLTWDKNRYSHFSSNSAIRRIDLTLIIYVNLFLFLDIHDTQLQPRAVH